MKVMNILEFYARIMKTNIIELHLKIIKIMKILESYDNLENHEILKTKNEKTNYGNRRILCENNTKT